MQSDPEQKRTYQWITSLAVTVACCATFFLVSAGQTSRLQNELDLVQIRAEILENKLQTLEAAQTPSPQHPKKFNQNNRKARIQLAQNVTVSYPGQNNSPAASAVAATMAQNTPQPATTANPPAQIGNYVQQPEFARDGKAIGNPPPPHSPTPDKPGSSTTQATVTRQPPSGTSATPSPGPPQANANPPPANAQTTTPPAASATATPPAPPPQQAVANTAPAAAAPPSDKLTLREQMNAPDATARAAQTIQQQTQNAIIFEGSAQQDRQSPVPLPIAMPLKPNTNSSP